MGGRDSFEGAQGCSVKPQSLTKSLHKPATPYNGKCKDDINQSFSLLLYISAIIGCGGVGIGKVANCGILPNLYLLVIILGLVQVFSPSVREKISTKNSN